MKTDVIIIGGGAAGLCAAVYLKQKSPQMTVRILEALPRVGKKLITTGKGRCNITNNADVSEFFQNIPLKTAPNARVLPTFRHLFL